MTKLAILFIIALIISAILFTYIMFELPERWRLLNEYIDNTTREERLRKKGGN